MKRKQNQEMEQAHNRTNPAKPVLGGFLVGSVIGVAAALLFAPRAGEETRAEIRGRAIDLRDRTTETVKDTVSQVRSRANEVKENAREKAEELKQRGKHAVTRRLDDVAETVKAGKEKIQEY